MADARRYPYIIMNNLINDKNESDKLFIAIGKFLVSFSELISITEHLTSLLLSEGGNEDVYRKARIVVSNSTAKPLADSFFSLLKDFETKKWTGDDELIVKEARKEFDNLIKKRNRFAHDVWHLGHPNLPRPSHDSWHSIRSFGSPRSGLKTEFEEITIDKIESWIKHTKRIDVNIRQLALAGLGGEEYRPGLHMKIHLVGNCRRVVCNKDIESG